VTQIFDPAPQAAYPGEVMACVFCDVKDIAVSSLPAWESLQVGERRYYACPEEFPTEGDLTEAYVRFFTRVATMTAPQKSPVCLWALTNGSISAIASATLE